MEYTVGKISLSLHRGKWILNEPLGYVIDGKVFLILDGFETDGASIPRFLWVHLGHPLSAGYVKAAILHDFLYSKVGARLENRKRADKMFRMILEADNVGFLSRWLMWAGVRVFGKFPYKKR